MTPYQMVAGGTFTATLNTAVSINLQSQDPPDYFVARNLGTSSSTGWGEVSDAQAIEWFWYRSMGQGVARGIVQTSDGTNPAMIARVITADGITTYDTANPPTFAGLATTVISAANPAVCTMAETGTISVGDIVRVTGSTGMLQIAGYDFQVRAVSNDASVTLMIDSSGFAAAATAGTVTKFIPNRMYPRYRYISSITQAAQAVVSFTVNNDFTPGEIVSFRVSSAYGMDDINNVTARVLSVTNSSTASSITIDLDTTGYTAFAFPTSAVADAGVSPAVCVPSGSGVVPDSSDTSIPQQPPGTNLRAAFDNRNVRVINLGASLFTDGNTGDVWQWQAFKYSAYNAT